MSYFYRPKTFTVNIKSAISIIRANILSMILTYLSFYLIKATGAPIL